MTLKTSTELQKLQEEVSKRHRYLLAMRGVEPNQHIKNASEAVNYHSRKVYRNSNPFILSQGRKPRPSREDYRDRMYDDIEGVLMGLCSLCESLEISISDVLENARERYPDPNQ